MNSIAIITARGGSKRIPHKNIKSFCGKPIIEYSIDAALCADRFEEVMVSTDDETIAKISMDAGASVPFLRSEKTSNDYATTADVLKEVLQEYAKKGKHFDMLCCIYPTAPFVTAEKLRSAVDELSGSSADSIMPVVAYSYPPQRGLVIRDGCVQFQYPEYEASRSQDLETIYHDCGQFYVCKIKAFESVGTLVTKNTIPFFMPEEEVQDIDNLSDWALAEMKYRAFLCRKNMA